MSTSGGRQAVAVTGARLQHTLSAAQKKFNTLTAQIAEQRTLLAAWQEADRQLQVWHAQHLRPLIDELRQATLAHVLMLEQEGLGLALSKRQEQQLGEVIRHWVAPWLPDDESGRLRAVFERHGDASEQLASPRTEANPAQPAARQPPEDEATPGEWQTAAQAHRDQHRARRVAAKQAREDTEASASVRTVYRKLASALHPDRATNPGDSARKTELMQRVNQAYDTRDLLTLLNLQLEIEQIDQRQLDTMADERVVRFNKVLGDQLARLREEVETCVERARLDFRLGAGHRVPPPDRLQPLLREHKRGIEYELAGLRRLTRELQDDPKALKAWLKEAVAAMR